MEFTHEFTVPTDVDTAFATLTDLEKVAPCLPGATLDEVDGDTYSGKVKVKVGPIQVVYAGTARVTETDTAAKRARIEASGKETRGTGTASANVVAQLEEVPEGTSVKVTTDLNITGKPAQFGRGVMAEVGTKIIGTFADRLDTMLREEELEPSGGEPADAGAPSTAAVASSPASAAASSATSADVDGGPTPAGAVAQPGPEAVATGAAAVGAGRSSAARTSDEDDALDLMEFAGAATAKRLLPILAVVALLVGLLWRRRR